MKRNTVIITLAIVALLAVVVVACQMQVAEGPAQDTGPELAMQSRDSLLSRDGGNAVEVWNGGDIVMYSNEGSTARVLIEGAQGLAKFTVPTAVGTATPAVLIDNQGSVANSLEVRKNATPVFYVDVDGNVTYTGMTSAGGLISAAVGVAAPTAVGTATPAFYVDSLGVSNLFEVRDAATPVFSVANGGAVTGTGALSVASLDTTAGATFSTWIGFDKQTALPVTFDTEISPVGTYTQLSATEAVGTGSITAGTAGQLLILTNISAHAITITDTATIMLGGNRALDQYDTLVLLSDGTNWLELSYTDN